MQNYNWKERLKTELTGRSPLKRRRFALDCSAIWGEEEGEEDYIKNYKILSENKLARHMSWVVSFISNTTISDLFLLLCYNFSTSSPSKSRNLTYWETNLSVLWWLMCVFYVVSHRVTEISTSRPSLNLWPQRYCSISGSGLQSFGEKFPRSN
jgi:hypothetical protein